ncbi:MAG: TetR/AcrR family transcriptional regulator [Lentisphaerae bacterium]|jgi:AcrR family transcriptional regulator|nr:TetR/AcrR family transcriptional regulator [Lentisphaerota bacterium]
MAKDDKASDVKERLLMAGLKVFAGKGYDGSTVREICEEAGSNIAAINYYFGDKAGFYGAVRNYARQVRRDNMQRCWDLIAIDPWQALRAHIDILLDSTYNSTMSQINWLHMRDLVDTNNLHLIPQVPNRDKIIKSYEERMTSLLSALLGPAATEANVSLVRYTYHSLCLFLPIQTHAEQQFFHGKGPFSLGSNHDKTSLTNYILDIVKHVVDDMKAKHESTPSPTHA